MHCPNCGRPDTRVIDSRDLDEGATIRRRCECGACSWRFTTYERAEAPRLVVLKSDGKREEFDRAKLRSGLEKALTRRPVPAAAADQIADEIEAHFRALGASEVRSGTIGELAMQKLRALDHIAFIRFASVYQSYEDIETLKREVDQLLEDRAP